MVEWKQVIPTTPGIYLVKRPSSAEIKTFEVYEDDKDGDLCVGGVNSYEGLFLKDVIALLPSSLKSHAVDIVVWCLRWKMVKNIFLATIFS